MFYFISGVKNRCLEFIPLDEKVKRDELKHFFSFEHIFNNKIFPHVYAKDNKIYIDCEQILQILPVLAEVFSLHLTLDDFKKQIVNAPDCVPFFADSMKAFNEQIIVVQKAISDQKVVRKNFDRQFKTPLPISCEGLKLVSLDFEFANVKNQRSKFFEMGISTQENGCISHYHYIIGSNVKCKSPFNFGESQIIDVSDINTILSQHLQNADYLVGHNVKSEYKLLNELDFDWSHFSSLNFLCTAYLGFANFQIFRDDNTSVFDDEINLGLALKMFNIPAHSLHNSGNDAGYTLMLLNSMIELKTMSLTMNPKQRKKIKIKRKTKKAVSNQ